MVGDVGDFRWSEIELARGNVVALRDRIGEISAHAQVFPVENGAAL
jgi:hypothetical protein